MKLGFLTACMLERPLEAVAAWAGAHGYDALEIAAWPPEEGSGGEGHIAVDAFDEREAERIRRTLDANGLTLSSIACYENNLDPDPAVRAAHHDRLRACVDAAAALGGVPVGTFVGRDPRLTVAASMREAERMLPPLVAYAEDRGVKLMIENCVMDGLHPDGGPGNLAYSPELWEWLFDLGLYLNFDPSHLPWLGIDPIAALEPYVDRVIHAHAKDVEIVPELRDRFGFFGSVMARAESSWDSGGWWRFRVPGHGQLDFARYVETLRAGGFDGVLSVEHEDADWLGAPERVEQGLVLSHETLRPLIR